MPWWGILIIVLVAFGSGYGFRGKIKKGLHAADNEVKKIKSRI
jgi:hypothetical protein